MIELPPRMIYLVGLTLLVIGVIGTFFPLSKNDGMLAIAGSILVAGTMARGRM
jgi:hypothetical protein